MVFIPPRLYCEDCFCGIPDENWVEVKAQGVIRTNTTAMIDAHNEPLDEPVVMALIEIDDTDGAILGRIKTDMLGMDLTGMMVKAKLRPKKDREGTMKDILYFEPY